MAEHKYAQVLRWIADGKAVQCKAPRGGWVELEEAGRALQSIGLGISIPPEDYRLKPRTVKIGSREVEAPVLEPVLEPGTPGSVWTWNSDYCRPSEHPDRSCVATEQYALGLCFATEEACRAAHDAIHALLRGEA